MTPSEDRVLNKLREEIARIIDAEGWAFADQERQDFPADPHERIYGTSRLKRSLAKADQIIAAWNRRADPLVEELRGALEPFAKAAGTLIFKVQPDDMLIGFRAEPEGRERGYTTLPTAGDFRRAREALALPVGGGSACTNLGGEEPDGSFAGEAQSQSEDELYRGFRIYYDPPPIPTRECDWHWVHNEYDGPEDNRCGHAPSLEAAKAEVDFWHEESGQ